jgi:hypothetical protein
MWIREYFRGSLERERLSANYRTRFEVPDSLYDSFGFSTGLRWNADYSVKAYSCLQRRVEIR